LNLKTHLSQIMPRKSKSVVPYFGSLPNVIKLAFPCIRFFGIL